MKTNFRLKRCGFTWSFLVIAGCAVEPSASDVDEDEIVPTPSSVVEPNLTRGAATTNASSDNAASAGPATQDSSKPSMEVDSPSTVTGSACTDIYPFDDGYSCDEQVAWGKCSEAWMADACDLSCGRCEMGSGDESSGTSDNGPLSCDLDAADSMATKKTKSLLCYLKTHQFISGQTDVKDAELIDEATGRYPAIVAFDFYRYTDGDTSETQKAIAWSQHKKGIVAFQWHWKAPGGGEYYSDFAFENDLNNASSKMVQDINLVCSELKKMGDAGVPVLFRPLHEANNNFMWWAKRGSDNYKSLWRVIFQRCTALGAHNLIWVFNGMARDQSTPLSDWYPGDDVVDVISSDYYQSYDDLVMMQDIGSAKNKVVAIAETFHQLDPATDPPYSYAVVWASRDWGTQGAMDDWRRAMENPATIAIDNLPDMSAWE